MTRFEGLAARSEVRTLATCAVSCSKNTFLNRTEHHVAIMSLRHAPMHVSLRAYDPVIPRAHGQLLLEFISCRPSFSYVRDHLLPAIPCLTEFFVSLCHVHSFPSLYAAGHLFLLPI